MCSLNLLTENNLGIGLSVLNEEAALLGDNSTLSIGRGKQKFTNDSGRSLLGVHYQRHELLNITSSDIANIAYNKSL